MIITFIPLPAAYAEIFSVFRLGDGAPFLEGLRDGVVRLASAFFDQYITSAKSYVCLRRP